MSHLGLISCILLSAVVLDQLLGETSRFHPLVGFGKASTWLESKLNRVRYSSFSLKLIGIAAWFVLIIPIAWLYTFFYQPTSVYYLIDALIVYLAIGQKSLRLHALAVYEPLKNNDIPKARQAIQMIVSRQTSHLTKAEISRATVESVLENGHDAVVATLFWYFIGGAPAVIVHRLANTLDAMWGYKNNRFLNFGWFAAKADDWLGWPSAKLTGLLFILSQPAGWLNIKHLLINAYRQSQHYKSLNGGWVMSAGASSLKIMLGGRACYHGEVINSASLGEGREPTVNDIKRAINLVTKASLLFIAILFVVGIAL
ncbi:adenosylcobinamide-phosphate synthase CbiB [Aliikangiella sp. IMCC44359]|uniref:adenosylcobinamide-phosphate synthase CbiB n=1 Tax=Aliikangiella sp. IMCC44359 TaxID=3459125 RepID=UPI00403AB162